MWIQNFFKSLTSTPTRRRPIRRRPPASRLCLEALEDRCLPSFSPAISYPVGAQVAGAQLYAVVTGAFRGAGYPLDLAVANNNTVSVLLGNGDGTFQAAPNIAIAYGPASLAIGDFNNDGKLDIVTAGGSTVSVLLGNGNGTFQAPLNYVVPTEGGLTQSIQSLTVGDFDNDGKFDVAVATHTVPSPSSLAGYVNVLISNGAGGFATDNVYALAGIPASVAVGDFTGHGNLDLAVAEPDKNAIGILLGNGNGTFGSETDYASGPAPNSLAVGDINGDGKLDLITTNSGGSVSVILGNGNGSFQSTLTTSLPAWSPPGYNGISPLPLQQHATSLAVGDFDRDGKLDLAVTANSSYTALVQGAYGYYPHTYYRENVNVLLGHGDGTFADAEIVPINSGAGSSAVGPVAVGDFTGDSWPDLAVIDSTFRGFLPVPQVANNVSVLLNAADWGTQANIVTFSGFPSPTTAGVPGNYTVTIHNPDRTIDTAFTGTVSFSSSDPQAVLPYNYTFTSADAGVHTFSATLTTAGTQSITATDTATPSLTGGEVGITVNPAAANTMIVSGFPLRITAGVAGTLTVTLNDAYGNIATGYTGTVHFTSSDGKASLPANYTFTAADAGVHTFSVTLKTAGTQSLTATDTTTASLYSTDGGITVKPAAASRFILSAPASVSAGVPFSLTLTVQDAYGNVVTGYTGTIHFASTDTRATLPKNYTFTAADKGVHTFTGLVLRKRGTQKITLTDTLNSSLTGSVIENVL